MTRPLLDEKSVHSAIKSKVGGNYDETVDEVVTTAANTAVLVVGMAQNPYCKKVRKQLEDEKIDFAYLEYGSYFKEWHRRLAIKMWCGWSTLPMVFVNGQLVGGNQEVQDLISSGELKQLLAKPSQ